MSKPYFSRILLKISGEALGGDHGGLDASAIFRSAQLIEESVRSGVQTAVIIGAGNLFRGLEGSRQGMERIGGDYAGMLATCMNALVMRDALQKLGLKAEIQSSLPIAGVLPPFDYREAQRMLDEGTVVLFSAGTGHPFFSTDTTAALRALEVKAEAVFKATKVDGIYTADPVTNPDATRFQRLTYDEALSRHLKVMDSNAFALCQMTETHIRPVAHVPRLAEGDGGLLCVFLVVYGEVFKWVDKVHRAVSQTLCVQVAC